MEKPRREKDDEPLSSLVDRISELPEPILHHILCFLPQDQAVQTCVLSKSWRHLWCTCPNIELCQDLSRLNTEAFLSIFNHTLQRYHRDNLSINRFVLKMWWVNFDLILLIEKWIPIVLKKVFGVETFHLMYPQPSYGFHHHLPLAPVIFQAELLKELCLSGFQINSIDAEIHLKHLQMLSLYHVSIKDKVLEKILAGCPLIQRVDLDHCNVHRSKDLFGIFSFNSAYLEHLELRSCSGFEEVKILSCSVKRLIIVDPKNQVKTIIIDAPDILYFEFSCRSSVSSVSFPSVSFSTTASREWKSNMSIPFQLERSNIDIVPWFLKLNEVLMALRQSRITLNLYSWNRHIKGINCVGCYEPVAVELLNLMGFASSDCFGPLFNCLFRIVRPRYTYTRMYHQPKSMQYLQINKLAKFVWKTNLMVGEFSSCYFWQRELKELRLELLDDDSKKWFLVRGSRLPVIASPNVQEIQSIRFIFDWSESFLLA